MKIKALFALGVSSIILIGCAASGEHTVDASVDRAIDRAEKRVQSIRDESQKIAVYERIYKSNPKSPKASSEYARMLRKAGQLSKAQAVLRLFAEQVDSPHYVYAEYAAIMLAKGEHGEAELFAQDALEKDGANSFALHTLGISLDGQGRYKEAEEAFRSALDSWEGNPVPVMNNLALNLATQGYIDEAISILERAKTLDPSRQELERNLRIIRALNEGSAAYFPEHNVPHPVKKPKES